MTAARKLATRAPWPREWCGGPARPNGPPAIVVEIDVETVNPANGTGKSRWAKIHRTEEQRGAVEGALTFADDRLIELCERGPWCVRLTRLSSAARPLDDDAPPGALKAVRDAVAAALDVDDGDEAIAFAYAQEKRKGPLGVRVEVWGGDARQIPLFPEARR